MGSVISSLGFMAPRTVTIYDWRLGTLYWTMAAFTYGYVVQQMIYYKAYTSRTPAEGFFDPQISAIGTWPPATSDALPYCGGTNTYKVGNETYGPFACDSKDLSQGQSHCLRRYSSTRWSQRRRADLFRGMEAPRGATRYLTATIAGGRR